MVRWNLSFHIAKPSCSRCFTSIKMFYWKGNWHLITPWGNDSFFITRTMDVFITKLRKHLQLDPAVEIINVRGMGYT